MLEYIINNRLAVGITENNSAKVPSGIQLNSCYPNPFNPVTMISYSTDKTSAIKLTVYNIKGELVTTLVDQVQSSGLHSVKFNAAGLNSGVYLYKLQSASKSITNKMILLK